MSSKDTTIQKVVTRFAPSPTGFMHVGGIRTALFAWAYARKHNGTFILRIEDTDKEREVVGSIDHIIESLRWLGITWDEGPDIGGPHAPYIQSERLPSYKQYAEQLVEKGLAYADPYTVAEVEEFRQKSIAAGKPFLFREYRPENPPAWDGTQPLRLKVANIKSYTWHDLIRGDLSAGPEALDDFILIKSDGYPTYNFAHIIDDVEMGVTHIMRTDEFIASTPKYLSLYEALGITRPTIATLPPIMGADGKKKLGKRDGAKDILEYRTDGYLPSAVVNFLAYIGWNPGDEREILTPKEFVDIFDIERVQISGGRLNEEKLNWINKEYLKRMSVEEQRAFVTQFLPDRYKNIPLEKLAPLILERAERGRDITDMAERGEIDFYVTAPQPTKELLCKAVKNQTNVLTHIDNTIRILSNIDTSVFTAEKIKESLWGYATEHGRGDVLWPMRVALSGLEKSPDPFIIASVIGKNEAISRLMHAKSLV